MFLAERFPGTGPLYWEDAPADRRERVLSLLRFEGEVAKAFEGLGPDDDVSPDYFDE